MYLRLAASCFLMTLVSTIPWIIIFIVGGKSATYLLPVFIIYLMAIIGINMVVVVSYLPARDELSEVEDDSTETDNDQIEMQSVVFPPDEMVPVYQPSSNYV